MVGDSWPADIVGARAAGIRAIWFNRARRPAPDASTAVCEVASLVPMDAILHAIFPADARSAIRDSSPVRIGIDLGGTKIEAIALDADGRERFRHRVATPRGDYAATVEAVALLVVQAEAVVGRSTVGVGMPGVVSPATGLVKNANSTWLNGRPLSEDLASRLERPVRLANDANCFALSEATDGAAAGLPVVFGVILGTGVGGGLIVNGRVVTGANAIAGEWGHNPLPWPEAGEWPGPPCYCGRTGCIETFLSGPGLARDFRDRTGRDADAAGLAAEAQAGNADALESDVEVRAPACARAGVGHQCVRPGRDRARRRRVEHRPSLRARAEDLGRVRFFRHRRHAPRARRPRRLERRARCRLAVGVKSVSAQGFRAQAKPSTSTLEDLA